jgi:PBP1b-binding outer membrane lipoprotein LpoB
MKKIIYIIVISLIFITGCTSKQGVPYDLTGNIAKITIDEQLLKQFNFQDISLISNNNSSILEIYISNITDAKIDINLFKVIIKNLDNEVLVNTVGYIGGSMKPGESKKMIINIDVKLNKNYIIEIKKES